MHGSVGTFMCMRRQDRQKKDHEPTDPYSSPTSEAVGHTATIEIKQDVHRTGAYSQVNSSAQKKAPDRKKNSAHHGNAATGEAR